MAVPTKDEMIAMYVAGRITPANIEATGEFADKAVDMLIKIGETQWIKAKKINALKTCQRGIKKQWDVYVHTDREKCVYGTYDTKDEALHILDYLASTINSKTK